MKPLFLICFFILYQFTGKAQDHHFDWAKQFGGGLEDVGFSIATDPNGNIYATGYFNGTGDFDPGPGTLFLTSAGDDAGFILKLNTDGTLAWAKQVSGSGSLTSAICRSITINQNGDVLVVGSFSGSVDFDPGAGVNMLQSTSMINGMRDIFILNLDANGNFKWVKHFGGPNSFHALATGISNDSQGNIFTTGLFCGTFDFDPGPGIYNLTAGMISHEAQFISKLDANGNFLWAKKIGNAQAECYAYAIKVDDAGNVITSGGFLPAVHGNSCTVDFDPGPGISNLSCPALQTEVFVLKLDGAGNFIWAKSFDNLQFEIGNSISVDATGNTYLLGTLGGVPNTTPTFITKLVKLLGTSASCFSSGKPSITSTRRWLAQ